MSKCYDCWFFYCSRMGDTQIVCVASLELGIGNRDKKTSNRCCCCQEIHFCCGNETQMVRTALLLLAVEDMSQSPKRADLDPTTRRQVMDPNTGKITQNQTPTKIHRSLMMDKNEKNEHVLGRAINLCSTRLDYLRVFSRNFESLPTSHFLFSNSRPSHLAPKSTSRKRSQVTDQVSSLPKHPSRLLIPAIKSCYGRITFNKILTKDHLFHHGRRTHPGCQDAKIWNLCRQKQRNQESLRSLEGFLPAIQRIVSGSL